MSVFHERRCQLGIHNYVNFLDSSIHIEYEKDIPNEVLICQLCKYITTAKELIKLQRYEEVHDVCMEEDI